VRARAAAAILLALGLAVPSCGTRSSAELRVEGWTLEPAEPRVGPLTVRFRLATAAGPLAGARVALEGDMTHPGMTPSLATARELEPGSYEGTLQLTMGGDWFVVVRATTAAGETLEKIVELKGVRSP
jgi:hypothetical protein